MKSEAPVGNLLVQPVFSGCILEDIGLPAGGVERTVIPNIAGAKLDEYAFVQRVARTVTFARHAECRCALQSRLTTRNARCALHESNDTKRSSSRTQNARNRTWQDQASTCSSRRPSSVVGVELTARSESHPCMMTSRELTMSPTDLRFAR